MRRWLNVAICALAVAAGRADVCRGELRYVLTDLGALGMPQAYDINNHGEVVGGGGYRAWLYDGHAVIDLGLIDPGGAACARAINDQGEIVGWWSGANVNHSVLYYDGLLLHDVGLMGGHITRRTTSVKRATLSATLDSVLLV